MIVLLFESGIVNIFVTHTFDNGSWTILFSIPVLWNPLWLKIYITRGELRLLL